MNYREMLDEIEFLRKKTEQLEKEINEANSRIRVLEQYKTPKTGYKPFPSVEPRIIPMYDETPYWWKYQVTCGPKEST